MCNRVSNAEDADDCVTGFTEDAASTIGCEGGVVCRRVIVGGTTATGPCTTAPKGADATEGFGAPPPVFVKRRPSERCACIIIAITMRCVSYCYGRYFVEPDLPRANVVV